MSDRSGLTGCPALVRSVKRNTIDKSMSPDRNPPKLITLYSEKELRIRQRYILANLHRDPSQILQARHAMPCHARSERLNPS